MSATAPLTLPTPRGEDGHRRATARRFSGTAALGSTGAALVALAGLLGYVSGWWSLGALRADFIPMAPSTAACILILSAVLFRQTRTPWQGPALAAALALAALVAVFGLLIVVKLVAGIDVTFEDRLFPDAGTLGAIPVGRMSPATGATCVLAGVGTFLSLLRSLRPRHAPALGHGAATLGAATVLVGATVLLAYVYGAPLMYGGTAIPMAATTAIAFIFLGTALVAAAGPASFPMRHVTGDATSALLARVFLPLAVAAVLLPSVLLHLASAAAALSHPLTLAALAAVVGLITVAMITRVAHVLGGRLDESSRKLRESEERFHQLAVQSGSFAWEVDARGLYTFLSRAAEPLLGYRPDDVVDRLHFYDLHPEAGREAFKEAAFATFARLDTFRGLENLVQTKDGREVWVSTDGLPLLNADGTLRGYRGSDTDITGRKHAEEAREALQAQLHQARKAESLGRMAGAIAHHYNNLLGAVLLNLEVALNKLPADAGARANLTEAMKVSQRAAEISRQLLDYLGQGHRGKREPADLGEACRAALALLPSSLLTNARLTTDIPAQPVTVRADAAQLKRVLTNLVVNASEAFGDGEGHVTISTGVISAADIRAARFYPADWQPVARTYAWLAVADTGCGMTPETMDNVFDPFFSTKFTGRGLGLPVVLGIVMAYEGACAVESRPALGTTFRIFLPVADERPSTPR